MVDRFKNVNQHPERSDQDDVERANEEGKDAKGDLEAQGERNDTTNVHEGGDSVIQKRKHHYERPGTRPKPGRVDLQDARGNDKPLAAKVVLHRSLFRLSMEGTVASASKLTSNGTWKSTGYFEYKWVELHTLHARY